jgi:multisubunit Na+/H+ antiporter MnhG subunit
MRPIQTWKGAAVTRSKTASPELVEVAIAVVSALPLPTSKHSLSRAFYNQGGAFNG